VTTTVSAVRSGGATIDSDTFIPVVLAKDLIKQSSDSEIDPLQPETFLDNLLNEFENKN
jgi:hypothetical protein